MLCLLYSSLTHLHSRMPDHMGYNPNFPTFKHSDKFESRAMVKMMQKEATLAERAWEERTSQRDNNKVYFNHLTRDEAEIEMKIRMDKYQPDKEDDFSYSGNSIKILDFKNYCRMNLPGRAYL